MINIAIDGFAGVGKSSVCNALAKKLKFTCINSGLFYRIIAKILFDNNLLLTAEQLTFEELEKLWEENKVTFSQEEVLLFDKDIMFEIQNPMFSQMASDIAVCSRIRDFINHKIKKIVEIKKGFVIEGRDVATNIIPEAEIKVFLQASLETRTNRRFEQLKNKGLSISKKEQKEQIFSRDKQDQEREYSPLEISESSIVIDTDKMLFSEVVETLEKLALEALKSDCCDSWKA